MNAEIFAALAQLEKERGIPQSYMVEKITQALVAAYKKDKDGYTDNVFVEVKDNDMHMYVQKEVVDDVLTPATEISLDEARKNDAETFDNLATAYARAAHISKPELGAEYDRSLMGEVELALADASEAAQTAVDAALAAEDYPAAFAALAALRAPIDRFFDEVMVMDKDEQLRDNRLKLLNRFEAVFSGIANIGELARKK